MKDFMVEPRQERERGVRLQINTTKYPVVIQITHKQIHGDLPARENERIKDGLNSNESFISITTELIFNAEGSIELSKSEFLAINRSHINWTIEDKVLPRRQTANTAKGVLPS